MILTYIPTLKWSTDYFDGYVRPVDRRFLTCFLSMGLSQWVKEPTFVPSGNILDLILTSEDDRVSEVVVLPPLPHCLHCPVMCDYTFRGLLQDELEQGLRRLWHRGNYHRISDALAQVDWGLEFSYSSACADFSFLQSIVTSLVDKYVPVAGHRNGPPWSLKPPTRLIKQRATAWQTYKRVRREEGRNSDAAHESLNVFHEVNAVYRNYSLVSRRNYELELIGRPDNRKLFHSYIRHKKVGRPAVGPLRLSNGRRVDEPGEMCEVFAASFAGVFVGGVPANPAPFQSYGGHMEDIVLTRDSVTAALQALDPSSSPGLDGFHPHLLKACAAALAIPLRLIFVKSLRTGLVPTVWKMSLVVPLFKKSSHADRLGTIITHALA